MGDQTTRPVQWAVETRAGVLPVTRARPDDIPAVIDLQSEAAGWLLARGIDQWLIDRAQTADYLRTALSSSPPAREVYLAWRDGEPVATLALQTSDQRTWGDLPDDALYLHSFAVRRSVGGQGVGRALLRWAEGIAAVQGKAYLRLDCMAENAPLCAYYERAGFAHLRDVSGKNWSARLFEKRVRP